MPGLDPAEWIAVSNGTTTVAFNEERIGITDPDVFIRAESRPPNATPHQICYVERLPDTDQSDWNPTSGKLVRVFELVDYPSRVAVHRFCASLIGYPFTVAVTANQIEFVKGLRQSLTAGKAGEEQNTATNLGLQFTRVGRHCPDRCEYLETYGVVRPYMNAQYNRIDSFNRLFLNCSRIDSCIGRGGRGTKTLANVGTVLTRQALNAMPDYLVGTEPRFLYEPTYERFTIRVVYELLPYVCPARPTETSGGAIITEADRFTVKTRRNVTELLSGNFGDPGSSTLMWDISTQPGEPPSGKKVVDNNVPPGNQTSVIVIKQEITFLWQDVPQDCFNFAFIEACFGRVNAQAVSSYENGEVVLYEAETLLLVACEKKPTRSSAGRFCWDLEFKFLYSPNYSTVDGKAKGWNWLSNGRGYYQKIIRKSGDPLYRSFHYPDLFRQITAITQL